MKADVVLRWIRQPGRVFEVASRSEARLCLAPLEEEEQKRSYSRLEVGEQRADQSPTGGRESPKKLWLASISPAHVPIIPGPQLAQEVPRDASTVLSLKNTQFFRLYLRPR
jgi:hypothetical protein